MRKLKNIYIRGLIINIVIGTFLGIITELALIYNIKSLIKITQNELFWVLDVIIISIFSRNYVSTEINSVTNLTCMTISYYVVRLIKSGYTNIGGIYWFGLQSICVGLYIGTLVYLIKEKIFKKKITSYIPKMNMIFMTIFLIVSIGLEVITLYMNIFLFQPVYFVGALSIIGFICGTIVGCFKNNRKKIKEKVNITENNL